MQVTAGMELSLSIDIVPLTGAFMIFTLYL
jgi:hypothetical protein